MRRAEQKLKALKNSELEARAIDVQMLKFGQVVDLDALNTYTVNKSAEDLREKVRDGQGRHGMRKGATAGRLPASQQPATRGRWGARAREAAGRSTQRAHRSHALADLPTLASSRR